MKLNIIIIIILVCVPIGFAIKKIVEFFLTKRKREKVRILLSQEPNKKIAFNPSRSLRLLKQVMTPKYFANVFYKQKIPVVRYNMNEKLNVKKYLRLEGSQMESNYFFNMVKNNMSSNFYMRESVPKKYLNNFIIPEIARVLDKDMKQGYPKNILNIDLIIVGDSLLLPTQYYKNDIFICNINGVATVTHAEPSVINELDPYVCHPFARKKINDIETKFGMQELREGDYMYIPNGTLLEINFKVNFPNQIIFIIEFDNFQKNDKLDNEIDLIKLEQIQLRKIPRKVYPKDLQNDELELLWYNKIISGTNWEKNQIIKNIL